MTITGPKPGGWALNEVLTSSQLTALQTALERGVDGVGGGTYNPSPPLQLNKTKLTLDAIADLRVADQTLTYKVPLLPAQQGLAGWTWSAVQCVWTQTDVGQLASLTFPLQLMPGDVIDQFLITVKGASGHAGLPGTRVSAAFLRENIPLGTVNLFASELSPAANVAAYEVDHGITLDTFDSQPTYTVPSDSTRHYLRLQGETGSNAIPNLKLRDIQVTLTRKQLVSHQILF